MRHGFALLAAIALAVPAGAQTARSMLEYGSAAAMRDACIAYARDHQTTVAIAIYDDEGRLIAFAQMDGTSNAAQELAHWKARAAANYRRSTAEMANWGPTTMPGVATLPGGVPVFSAEGKPLGAIGVSGGANGSDTPCAQAGIAAAGLKEKAE